MTRCHLCFCPAFKRLHGHLILMMCCRINTRKSFCCFIRLHWGSLGGKGSFRGGARQGNTSFDPSILASVTSRATWVILIRVMDFIPSFFRRRFSLQYLRRGCVFLRQLDGRRDNLPWSKSWLSREECLYAGFGLHNCRWNTSSWRL